MTGGRGWGGGGAVVHRVLPVTVTMNIDSSKPGASQGTEPLPISDMMALMRRMRAAVDVEVDYDEEVELVTAAGEKDTMKRNGSKAMMRLETPGHPFGWKVVSLR